MSYRIAADTGGTFTDIVAVERETGQLRYCKTLTDYDDLVRGVLEGVDRIGVGCERIEVLKHGTTQVINAFLQRRGAHTARVTTRGFRGTLEIARVTSRNTGRPVIIARQSTGAPVSRRPYLTCLYFHPRTSGAPAG